MKKAALINLYFGFRTNLKERAVPLALMYLSNTLKEKGVSSIVVDIDTEFPDAIDQGIQRLGKEDLLFVGISATFGIFTSQMLEFARRFRELRPEVPMVWGGWHSSIYSDYFIKERVVDIIVKWEGEETLGELIEHFKNGVPLNEINGIVYKDGDEIKETSNRKWIEDLDSLGLDFDCVENYEPYIFTFPNGARLFQSYQSSRGCPYNCSFCYNNRESMVGGRVKCRVKSVEKVLEEIDTFRSRVQFDYIQFIDDYFFVDKNRGKIILEELYKRGIRVFNLELRANDFTPDLLEVLRKVAVKTVYFGLESENSRVLKLMNKGITRKQIDNALQLSGEYGLVVNAQMIMGVPTHTREEITDSIRFGLDMMAKYRHFNVGFVPYIPLRGTVMGEIVLGQGDYEEPKDLEGLSQMHGANFSVGYTHSLPWLKWASSNDIVFLQKIIVFMNKVYYPLSRRETYHFLRDKVYAKLIDMRTDFDEEIEVVNHIKEIEKLGHINKEKIDRYLDVTLNMLNRLFQWCPLKEELETGLRECDWVMIYGGGEISRLLHDYLAGKGISIHNFILTKPEPGQLFLGKLCIGLRDLEKKIETTGEGTKGIIINGVVYCSKEINAVLSFLTKCRNVKSFGINEMFQDK